MQPDLAPGARAPRQVLDPLVVVERIDAAENALDREQHRKPGSGVHSAGPAKLRNCSGLTRMAAPVGQARTQAAPPRRSLHLSHFTAFFGTSFDLDLASMPGSGPTPSASHERRLGRRRFGSTGASWITP